MKNLPDRMSTCEVSSFSTLIKERAILLNASMTFEATIIDMSKCENFEEQITDAIKGRLVTSLAVKDGKT